MDWHDGNRHAHIMGLAKRHSNLILPRPFCHLLADVTGMEPVCVRPSSSPLLSHAADPRCRSRRSRHWGSGHGETDEHGGGVWAGPLWSRQRGRRVREMQLDRWRRLFLRCVSEFQECYSVQPHGVFRDRGPQQAPASQPCKCRLATAGHVRNVTTNQYE